MSIRSMLIAILALPGTVLKQFIRRAICDSVECPVYRVSYTRFSKNPIIFQHAPAPNITAAAKIALLPSAILTLICSAMTVSSMTALMFLSNTSMPGQQWLLLWLGFAIGSEAFPDPSDLEQLSEIADRQPGKHKAHKTAAQILLILDRCPLTMLPFAYALLIAYIVPTIIIFSPL